jgi:hypothetical protein
VEARDTDGALQSLGEGTRALTVFGTSGTNHPYQTSWVTSLRTNLAGASGRGRLYWPATGTIIVAASLRPSAGDTTSFLSGVKTYLAAIQAAVTSQVPDSILAVWSRTLGVTLGVDKIQAGDVLDVQRRRRDAAIENYTETPYP